MQSVYAHNMETAESVKVCLRRRWHAAWQRTDPARLKQEFPATSYIKLQIELFPYSTLWFNYLFGEDKACCDRQGRGG